MSFIVFIIVIFVWWQLNSKINFLEKRVDDLSESGELNRVSAGASVHSYNNNPSPDQSPSPIPIKQQDFAPKQTYVSQANSSVGKNGFIDWLSEDFLVKVGGLLVIIAIGWFVSYAFANNWIGPIGRITLGLIIGASVLTFGVLRMRGFLQQGAIFTLMGSTTIIMTLFAAREIYDFFTAASALGLMFLTVVFMAFISLRSNLQSLAFATLVLGSVSPLLTNAPTPDVIALFSYLLVMTLGTLWVVWHTGWTKLTLASLIITFGYSLPFFFDNFVDQGSVMLFMFIFVATYFLANIISLVRRREEEINHLTTHVSTAIITAIFLVFWVETTAPEEWKSLLYTTWAFVFCLGTYVVYLYTANKVAFYLYGAVGLGLIGVATASELSGPSLTVAFLLEIGFLLIVSERLKASSQTLQYLTALLALPFILSLASLGSREWRDGIFHADFAVLLLSFLVFLSVGLLLKYRNVISGIQDLSAPAKLCLSVAGFFAVSLVWLVTHAVMLADVATAVSLITYTIFGLTFYLLSRQNNSSHLRTTGVILIGGVVVRLILVDVWNMNLEGRIITFLIIGVLLISTAFFNKHNNNPTKLNE